MRRTTFGVLFVDDEPRILASLKAAFWRTGWELAFAASAAQALAELEHRLLDVVVSDLDMPVMNGIVLFQILKRDHPKIVRIMLTGNATTTLAESEADLLLAKPCARDQLRAAIVDGFARRRTD